MTEPSRLLFVDDEEAVLSGLRRTFAGDPARYDLHFETDPWRAIETARATRPHVVVSDMKMPGLTGLEMVITMREDLADTRFIMLTGTADLDTAVDAINSAGIFRFYTKPCEPDRLRDGVAAALADIRPADNGRGGSLSERIGQAALNRLSLAVIVLDASARVLLTNNAGAGLLSVGDGLTLSAGEVCRASDPQQTAELHRLVKAAAGRDGAALGDGMLALARRSLGRPLNVAITAVEEAAGAGKALAVLFVSDPETLQPPPATAIARLFDLTGAESRLVHALALGDRLEDAAKRSGVTLSTARTYLKQVFSKTETSRQSELIRLVLTSPTITTAA